MPCPPAQKRAAVAADTNFTNTMEDYIAKAADINNSDIDFVDFDGSICPSITSSNTPRGPSHLLHRS